MKIRNILVISLTMMIIMLFAISCESEGYTPTKEVSDADTLSQGYG